MSTRVQYIFTSPSGELATVEVDCPKSDAKHGNFEAWCLTQVKGALKDRVDNLVEQGYSFSNWHFIESDRWAVSDRSSIVVFHLGYDYPAHQITTSKNPKRVFTNAFQRNQRSVRSRLSQRGPSGIPGVQKTRPGTARRTVIR